MLALANLFSCFMGPGVFMSAVIALRRMVAGVEAACWLATIYAAHAHNVMMQSPRRGRTGSYDAIELSAHSDKLCLKMDCAPCTLCQGFSQACRSDFATDTIGERFSGHHRRFWKRWRGAIVLEEALAQGNKSDEAPCIAH